MATGEATKQRMYTKSDLLERKWTPAAIKKWLGDPDATRRNPYSRKAPPMQLYAEERVQAAEQSDAWQSWLQGSLDRRQNQAERLLARHAVEREDSIQWAETVEIILFPRPPWAENAEAAQERRPLNQVTKSAIASYSRANSKFAASVKSDPGFLERITVNYLRHECTQYERLLVEKFGHTGVNIAQRIVRRRVYEAIAEMYPELAHACAAQAAARGAPMKLALTLTD
jgi:hypothetical protein